MEESWDYCVRDTTGAVIGPIEELLPGGTKLTIEHPFGSIKAPVLREIQVYVPAYEQAREFANKMITTGRSQHLPEVIRDQGMGRRKQAYGWCGGTLESQEPASPLVSSSSSILGHSSDSSMDVTMVEVPTLPSGGPPVAPPASDTLSQGSTMRDEDLDVLTDKLLHEDEWMSTLMMMPEYDDTDALLVTLGLDG